VNVSSLTHLTAFRAGLFRTDLSVCPILDTGGGASAPFLSRFLAQTQRAAAGLAMGWPGCARPSCGLADTAAPGADLFPARGLRYSERFARRRGHGKGWEVPF
jgi:hypothetical protein